MSTDIEPTVIDLEPKTPATEQIAAPEPTDTPTEKPENEEAAAPKTFTEEEVKAQIDAKAAEIRNRYERKLEKARIETETRAKVMQEIAVKPEAKEDAPNIEDFTDYNEYLRASARYEVKQEFAEQRRLEQEKETQRNQQSEGERKRSLEEGLMERGNTKYEDFEEVAEQTGDYLKSKNLKFSPVMVNALLETSNSQDIVYHLGKNLEDAARIAALPPYAQAKEIGKLEDKLLAKEPVKASNAPKPIEPIGSSSGSTKSLDEMSPEEYIKARRKQNPKWA